MLRLFLLALSAAALAGCALGDTYCEGPSIGWHKFGDFCYLLQAAGKRMSFYDAEDFCRSRGAHLVSIHSEEENKFLIDTISSHTYYGGRKWIGLNELRGDKEFEWTDGQPFDYNNIIDVKKFKKQRCYILYGKEGGWRSDHCGLQNTPICKRAASDVEPSPLPPLEPDVQEGNCPEEWIQFGDKCYKYFGAEEADRMKYEDALKMCMGLGGDHYDLVSIHSMKEQAFLTQLMYEFGTSAWIGYRYPGSDEIGHDIIFGWTDNSRVNFTYWASGHPPRGTWKYCTYLNNEGFGKGEWMADYCDINKRGFICQRPPDASLPEPTESTSSCADNYFEYKDSCYRSYTTAQNWDQAETTCQNDGGHLLSINDAFEQNFLYSQFFEGSTQSYWTGLRNVQNTRILKWSNGSPLYYSNWGRNEPQMSDLQSSCVSTSASSMLQWNVAKCDVEMPFICEITKETIPPLPADVVGDCSSSDSKWIDIGDKYCYYEGVQGSSKLTQWGDSSRYCISQGMEMLTLSSEHQMKVLFSYLWKKSPNYWLALIRAFDKDHFIWTDGSSLDYTNWAENEPSAWSKSYKKDCVAVSMNDMRWYPQDCSDWNGYICRSKKTIPGPNVRVARSDRSYYATKESAPALKKNKDSDEASQSSGMVPLLVAAVVCLGLSVFVAAMIFAWKRRNESELPTVLPVQTETSSNELSNTVPRY